MEPADTRVNARAVAGLLAHPTPEQPFALSTDPDPGGAAVACTEFQSLLDVGAHAGCGPHPLQSITRPEHLPAGVLFAQTAELHLEAAVETRLRFDLSWLRESQPGILNGTTGLRLNAAGAVALHVALDGAFQLEAWREDAYLRLRARAVVARPGAPDELLAALLGVHPLEWLRGALNEIGSMRWKRMAGNLGVEEHHLEAFLERWRVFGTRSEAVLWNAMGCTPALEQLHDAAAWIVEDRPETPLIRQRLLASFEQCRQFAVSPVGQWMEAAAGGPLPLAWDVDADGRIRAEAGALLYLTSRPPMLRLLERLAGKAERELDPGAPWPWALRRYEESLGEAYDSERFERKAEAWRGLRDRIYATAGLALAAQVEQELGQMIASDAGQDLRAPLVDACFSLDDAGLGCLRRLLAGHLAVLDEAPADCVTLRHGMLTHQLARTRSVEVRMPYLGRRAWRNELRPLLAGSVELDGTRLVVAPAGDPVAAEGVSPQLDRLRNEALSAAVLSAVLAVRDGAPAADHMTLNYTYSRRLGPGCEPTFLLRLLESYGVRVPGLPADACSATLSIWLPGHYAEVWSRAPHAREEHFGAVMCAVSRTIQAALRLWIPALHVQDMAQYSISREMRPLLAYHCSLPYTGIKKGDFGYDPIDHDSVPRALSTALKGLQAILVGVKQRLREAGRRDLQAGYDASQARHILNFVQRQQRNIAALLRVDVVAMEEMLRLSDCCRELRTLSASKPQLAARNLSRYVVAVTGTFERHLGGLLGKTSFAGLGATLLVEATAALAARINPAVSIAATLTLDCESGRQVYRNEAARRAA